MYIHQITRDIFVDSLHYWFNVSTRAYLMKRGCLGVCEYGVGSPYLPQEVVLVDEDGSTGPVPEAWI